jgi:hypothetical protein
MDPIRSLQSRALQKRNVAIAEARRVYKADIEAIDALDRRLPAPVVIDHTQPLSKPASIVDFVKAVAPTDKPFTVTDIMHLLHDAHAGQKFHLPTVRTHTSRLCSKGYFRKLYKTGQQETLYVLGDLPIGEGGIETKNMATVTHEILAEAGKSLSLAEIGFRMQERGYRADNTPTTLLRSIRDMFKRYPGRFKRDGGKWSATN